MNQSLLVQLSFISPVLPHITRSLSTNSLALRPRCLTSMAATTKGDNPARTAVITGANGGIGFETCKGLARLLPKIERLILCCRDQSAAETKVAQPLRSEYANRGLAVDVVPVDLSDSESVVQCVDGVTTVLNGAALDLLVCNAGIMACPLSFGRVSRTNTNHSKDSNSQQQQQPQDDIAMRIEKQYLVNHLSHALLVDRLLPILRKSDVPRIIFVSSSAVAIARGRDMPPTVAEKTSNTVTDGNYSKWGAYGDSKLAMSLFANAIAAREGPDIESVSLHPGVVQTDLVRYLVPNWMLDSSSAMRGKSWTNRLFRLFGLLYPEEGAALTLELSTAKRGTLKNGEMYVGLGGELASRSVIPMLQDKNKVDKLYNDTKHFVDSL